MKNYTVYRIYQIMDNGSREIVCSVESQKEMNKMKDFFEAKNPQKKYITEVKEVE